VFVGLAGLFALRAAGRGTAATAAPTSVARAPTTTPASAVIVPTVASTAAPLATATQPPQVVPTVAPAVVAALPTAAATVAPTIPAPSPTPLATPTPIPAPTPTATAIRPTATALPATTPPQPTEPPVPPTANAPVVAAGGGSSPAQAIQLFYQYVGQHQFDAAAQLWTAQMRAQYPPPDNINGRFGQDQRVEVAVGKVTMTGDGQATVAVDITEYRGGTTLRSVGSWQVVRGPSGWLLAQPNLRQA